MLRNPSDSPRICFYMGIIAGAKITEASVHAFTIPTSSPEADGTFAWNKTTLVLVTLASGSTRGIGYSYADDATATLVHTLLNIVRGRDALDIPAIWIDLAVAIRNLGRPGISSMAISGIDCALWDLKAKLLGLPLASLFGTARDGVPVYGSGGFTSYSDQQLTEQLGGWAEDGIERVKMKIGTCPEQDLHRVRIAREAIGSHAQLFVDANGAFTRKQALHFAEQFAKFDVCWFEEPVSSDDLAGLHLLRDRAPAQMNIAAGEYGYDLHYFRRMLEAESVDVLQADATRCAGFSGFLQVAALCQSSSMPMSAHCAPSLHLPVCCSLEAVQHIEYFHDHVRIEKMVFDGFREPVRGVMRPDLSRPGMGLEFKSQDAQKFAA